MDLQEHTPRFDDLPDLLTVPEVATLLRIGRGKAYSLVRQGDLPSLKLGRTLRIPKSAVERLAGVDAISLLAVNGDE